ncbi:uncharacterized protein [Rhodnius prolixus]|uniref:Uncharacterized protein n=1 Tax=Rhodnius prolixus TaxID=13249 RepID=T1ID88_RHOPR
MEGEEIIQDEHISELNKNISLLRDKLKLCQKSMKTLKSISQLLNPKAIGALKRDLIRSHDSCDDKVQKKLLRRDYKELKESEMLMKRNVEQCHRSHLNKYVKLIKEMEIPCNDLMKETENINDEIKSNRIKEVFTQFKRCLENEEKMKDEILVTMCTYDWKKPLITGSCEEMKNCISSLEELIWDGCLQESIKTMPSEDDKS